jgi:hypothetical protein
VLALLVLGLVPAPFLTRGTRASHSLWSSWGVVAFQHFIQILADAPNRIRKVPRAIELSMDDSVLVAVS